jgi:hypothetical protein
MILYPLYIDPGTGSALFSIFIGAAATFYFLFRALIIKLKVMASGGKVSMMAGTVHPYVIYSEGDQYWNVFKSVLDEFERRNTEVLYLTSAQNDPVFTFSYKFVKSEFIGEGNKAFARLNFLAAEVVLMTTPGLDVYQLKRSKSVKHYIHMLHAPSDATMYRMFGIDYFDAILLTGDYQVKDIRFLEQLRGLPAKELVIVGCTYLDFFVEKINQIPREENHQFTVLVSPSWGSSALLSRYGEKLLDPLAKTGWRIIVRPHPQSKKSEKSVLEFLEKRYEATPNFTWDYDKENIYSLVQADIMISDFSGIIYDFMFLCDKPVIYVKQGFDLRPYDADDLDHDLWQFVILCETGIELKEEYFPTIKDFILSIPNRSNLSISRKKAKNEAWQFQREAAKRTVDYMITCVKSISIKS